MNIQFHAIFYPGCRRHTSRELEAKFKDAFPTATIDWQRGQLHVDQQLAGAKQHNLPQILQDPIEELNGDVFHLEIPTVNQRSTLSGFVQYIDGWLGDSIDLEMTNFDLVQMIETSLKISEAIDFKFVLRHEERFHLDIYYEECVDPREFVDCRFQLSLNDTDFHLAAEIPIRAISIACEKLASDSPFKRDFEMNATSILDSLTSVDQIERSWAIIGSDGTKGALFAQSNWTSVFSPHYHAPNA